MPVKVADASVLGAVVFGEPRANEARSLIAGADLYEPALLAYELASIARKKNRTLPGSEGRYIAGVGGVFGHGNSLGRSCPPNRG